MKKLLIIIILLASTICYAASKEFQSGATYETCFTPASLCTATIVDLIGSAKKQILVQAYYLSYPSIIMALISAHNAGIDTHIILDKSQVNKSYIKHLTEAGIDVRIDFLPKIAHNKVIIIDNYRTLTGSFNFTNNAEFKNAENVLIINDMSLSEEYVINFFSRFTVSTPINKFKRK